MKPEITQLLLSDNYLDIILGLTILAQEKTREECEDTLGYYYNFDNFKYLIEKNYFQTNIYIKPIALVFPHVQFFVGNKLICVIDEKYIEENKLKIYE